MDLTYIDSHEIMKQVKLLDPVEIFINGKWIELNVEQPGPEERSNQLRDDILKYIADNDKKVDSIDITTHFIHEHINVILNEVEILEKIGKISREYDGMSYVYVVMK